MWEMWKQPTVLKTSRSEAILRGNGEMPVGWTVLWNEISTLPTKNEASFTFLFSNKGKWTAGEWLHERYHLNFPFEKIYNYLSSVVTVANFLSHVISSLPFWCRLWNKAHFNPHFAPMKLQTCNTGFIWLLRKKLWHHLMSLRSQPL